MSVLLYRRRFDLRSGAGQLIRMQAEGLRAAGTEVRLACQRGAWKFFMRTGLPVKRVSRRSAQSLCRSGHVVVDHGAELAGADLVFVHNLFSAANQYLEDAVPEQRITGEAAFFRQLRPATTIVANSQLIRDALVRQHGLNPQRIVVHYPGFESQRFAASRAARLRRKARAALELGAAVPLVGFITSGDMHKRGLDLFLTAAERIAAQSPGVRFLVVGARHLPEWAVRHPLFVSQTALYRPKNKQPELWLAALDVFLYAARFEEFGMVVAEAQALGIPVLTSRRVGAAECLPATYQPWLTDRPDGAEFAAKTLALLADEPTRRQLGLAGIANIAAYDRQHYVDAAVATILDTASSANPAGR